MMNHLKSLEQDVWEAWVEFEPASTSHFATLYISGEAVLSSGKLQSRPRIVETDYGTQLLLELPSRLEGRSRVREFFYSELLQGPSPYHSICIYAGEELIARFHDIEIMI